MFYEFLVKRLEHKNDPSGIFSAHFFPSGAVNIKGQLSFFEAQNLQLVVSNLYSRAGYDGVSTELQNSLINIVYAVLNFYNFVASCCTLGSHLTEGQMIFFPSKVCLPL